VAGAVFTPCGTEEGYVPLINEIVKNILVRNERVLGRAIFAAKCSLITWYPTDDYYYGPAVLYTTFGDPALRLKMPLPTAVMERQVKPAWADLRITPNPLQGSTTIRCALSQPGHARLRLYDATGMLVRTLADEDWPAGCRQVGLQQGLLPAGVYFVNLLVSPSGSGAGCRLTHKLIVE